MDVRALFFDVFGTVVDWRSGVAREVAALARKHVLVLDAEAFADAWRARYQPAMERVRSGASPWTRLDELHRANLDAVLATFGVETLSAAEKTHLNHAWHRLNPWPDSVAGITRLKTRYVVAPLSNGNVSLIVDMAKRAGLPWDLVLGAQVARAYKPQPEAYLVATRLLDLAPAQCMMVAAHNGDLVAAAACGLRTAFVPRPYEHGPAQTTDLAPAAAYDLVAADFLDLAQQLGC